MSDIEEMMKMYKEVQENYIKALERENEELRKQKEKDSLRIEELEKEILVERGKKYIKNVPQAPFDDRTVIGPGNGWGYPQNPVIYTTNKTAPATYQYDTTNAPTYIGSTAYSADVSSWKEKYEKVRQFQTMLGKLQKEAEDDN
jgi:hypothetical protein